MKYAATCNVQNQYVCFNYNHKMAYQPVRSSVHNPANEDGTNFDDDVSPRLPLLLEPPAA